MRRRKKYVEDGENLDRWLISYADFITLLFAFFVVMYSISSVNEGKYKVLSIYLKQAFSKVETAHDFAGSYEVKKKLKAIQTSSNDYPLSKINPIQLGNPQTTINPVQLDYIATEKAKKNRALYDALEIDRNRLKKVSEQFLEILEPYIDHQLVEVKRHDLWIELVLKSGMLFASGDAALSGEAMPVLKKIAGIIQKIPNTLHVEGHTDDLPINSIRFPSNWELSSARAASVVRQFEKEGVDSSTMAAIGYGEFHPVADNKFEEGRFKNRRVVLVLLSQSLSRFEQEKIEEPDKVKKIPKNSSNGLN